jgi:hypothetical protein
MKRFLGWSVVVLALAAVVGLVAKQGGAGSADSVPSAVSGPRMPAAGEAPSEARGAVTAGQAGASDALYQAGAPEPVPSPASGFSEDSGVDENSVSAVTAAIGDTTVAAGPKVIKTASLTIDLAEGRFDKAFADASMAASRHGGFIASSSTSRFDEARTASLVIRVPADRFDQALASLRELGDVVAEDASGEDVSATFVDLQARLRNWEAQESVLLRLMTEATTIDESIKVQRNLSDVQLNIERLRGQLRLLRDQTDMGTISLTLSEGDQSALREKVEDESILGKAWNDAVEGFQNVLAATVVGLGYLIPIGLLLLIVSLVVRRARRAPATAES